ncbi:MAG: DUF2796 domain-containing protein [Alphaproteobacteria bacterium]|jgi:hypothetical protein|nr:DUF2796 domain-containing protein [Alphaproteobacteria bacterium]
MMTDHRLSRTGAILVSVSFLSLAGCGGPDDAPPTNAGAPAEDARGAELGGEIRGADPEDRAETAEAEDADTAAGGEPANDETKTVDAGTDHGDDGDHDHDEMAGGEAHVHGHAEMAIVLEGNDLTVNVQAPLASFGLPESEPETEAESGEMEQARLRLQDPLQTVAVGNAARCIFSGSDVMFSYRGDHGSADIDYTFQCNRPDALTSVDVKLFEAHEGLEEVEAVFITGAEQVAKTLTASNTTISRD